MHTPGNLVALSDGRQLRLGAELGRGGEGAVFALADDDKSVAKLYSQAIEPAKCAKLIAMTRIADPSLLRFAAWPTATVGKDSERLRGFTMPRLTGYRPLHDLYNPASRKQLFPQADFKYLVHVARNLAAAFSALHTRGCVIGDVNQGNAFVHEKNGTVALIDCDSFQITHGDQQWLCEVGVAHFTPPELQALTSFRDQPRTTNHDAFGLAVLLFHVLAFGRHPYSGIYNTKDHILLEEAIRRHWFVYSARAPQLHLKPPPGTVSLSILGHEVARRFEEAFAVGTASRPTAVQWVAAMDALEKSLKRCQEDGAHIYPGHLADCPWCSLEEKTGTVLFLSRLSATLNLAGRFNIKVIWSAVEAVKPPPEEAPPAPTQLSKPVMLSPKSRMKRWQRLSIRIMIAAVPLALLIVYPTLFVWWIGLAWWLWNITNKLKPDLRSYQRAVQSAVRAYEEGVEHWRKHASTNVFRLAKKEVEQLRNQYQQLPSEYDREMIKLKGRVMELQRDRFLQRFLLRDAVIKGVGESRKLTLQSFGINTAADVSVAAVEQIPGFGEKLTDAVVQWRRQCETKFVFNPNQGLDPNDVTALYRKFDLKRRDLELKLESGVQRLAAVAQDIQKQRQLLRPRLQQLAAAMQQAKAELAANGG